METLIPSAARRVGCWQFAVKLLFRKFPCTQDYSPCLGLPIFNDWLMWDCNGWPPALIKNSMKGHSSFRAYLGLTETSVTNVTPYKFSFCPILLHFTETGVVSENLPHETSHTQIFLLEFVCRGPWHNLVTHVTILLYLDSNSWL